MGHAVLLLACHEQSFLVLLLEQHELHLIVLQCVVAVVGCALRTSGCYSSAVLWHAHSGVVVEFSAGAVDALLIHGTRLCATWTHCGILRHALVRVRTCSLHSGLHVLLDGYGIVLHRLCLNVSGLRGHLLELLLRHGAGIETPREQQLAGVCRKSIEGGWDVGRGTHLVAALHRTRLSRSSLVHLIHIALDPLPFWRRSVGASVGRSIAVHLRALSLHRRTRHLVSPSLACFHPVYLIQLLLVPIAHQ